jgi:predicted acetyltransferase
MGLEVRTLEAADLPGWLRAVNTGFLRAPTVSDEEVEVRRQEIDLSRTQGAYDAGRCVATFRSMPREVTVPGGALLDTDAITNVTVTATHRRRGLATRLMANDLRAAKEERGEALAILIAAEYPIYGRFGFGPATSYTEWFVEVPRAQLRPVPLPEGARIDLAEPAEVRKVGPEVHERFRRRTPGAINRTELWWQLETGEIRNPAQGWTEPMFAVYRDATGQATGLATYTVEEKWHGMYPECPLSVRGLIAATPEAEAALWRFLLSVDWVSTVKAGIRAPDDLLPDLLGDPRCAKVDTTADLMWVRVLDPKRALEARTYAPAPGALVLDIQDPLGHAAGRYRLEVAADGTAQAAPTTASPDLTLPVASLGALYLGNESVLRLAALGRLAEETPGAAILADALFRTPRRPWCPDIF